MQRGGAFDGGKFAGGNFLEGIFARVDSALPTGPIQTAAPSVSPLTAQQGTQVARTQGTYSARGGGSVSITTSAWHMDAVEVGTGANYTPGAGEVGDTFSYYEIATETGGTAPGTTITRITVGVVQAPASSVTRFDSNLITFDNDILTFDEAA